MRASARLAYNVETDGPLSPQVGSERKGANLNQPRPRSLAGATILQLVPSLRDDTPGRAALDNVRMLLQAGARAIVAGAGGPLADALHAAGGEFLPMPNDTFNPLRIHANTRRLSDLIANERIDIVHAHSAGAAWSAIPAARRMPVFLVTSFPDRLPPDNWPGSLNYASLSRGNRVIAPSAYVSRAIIERYKIAPERISVIPRAVDTAVFDPAAVAADRIAALRRAWRISPQTRVVLVAGGFAPHDGQLSMLEAARLLVGGDQDIAYVFAGEEHGEARHVGDLRRQAGIYGIGTFCRFVGDCAGTPAALAAADVVVVPALEPPLCGDAAAKAQAMGRPVVASAIGVMPESILCPPRMKEGFRTGWLARPGNASDLAHAIAAALALDVTAYQALSARARRFAEFALSPQSVAEALRGVYTSLLARDF